MCIWFWYRILVGKTVNYTFRDVALTGEEFCNLKWCVGEYKRICREQSGSGYGKEQYEIANNIAMFLDEVERLNKTVE